MDNIYSKLTSFSATNHDSLWSLAWGEKRRERILPHLLAHLHLIPQTFPSIRSRHHRGNTHLLSLLRVLPSVPTVQLPPEALRCVVSKVSPPLKPDNQSPPDNLCPTFHGPQRNLQLKGRFHSELSDPSKFHTRMQVCLSPIPSTPGSLPHRADPAHRDADTSFCESKFCPASSAHYAASSAGHLPGLQSPVSAGNPAMLV